jgi:hypothetical protein
MDPAGGTAGGKGAEMGIVPLALPTSLRGTAGEKARKWKKDTKIEGTNSVIYGK